MVEEIAAGILGAGGVIGGLEAKLIWHMVTRLKTATEELEFQARHDVLTELYNRRYIMEQFEHEMNQTLRYKSPLSVVMIDLDHFKEVNDTLGHAAGDVVLKEVASRLKQGVRAADVVGRWGGEEFLVLLPHASVSDAHTAAKKWLGHMHEEAIKLTDDVTQVITFSAGVASFDQVYQEGMDVEKAMDALLAEADKRLYQAKDNGRACIVGGEH
ncbi:MAG: GGDEF domain-containing protein, partial [Mariprofundaceae bacterium]